MLSRKFDGIVKNALGVALLSLLNMVCGSDARCQSASPSDTKLKELHGGIEISLRAVRAIALRVSTSAEGDNIKILSYDQLTPSTALLRDDKPTSEYIHDLAQTVQKLSEKMQRFFQIPPNQIHLLGLSELAGQVRDDLAREVRDKTGKEITFLDAKGEMELSIAGSIPRRYQLDGKWYDNRTVSLFLDIGATNIRGGYQRLRQASYGRAEYDYVTWETPIKGSLRAKAVQNAGLMTRKKVYLTGSIVWALTTLLYPEDQKAYVPLTMEDINNFYFRARTDPKALLNSDLSKIRDENTRNEARKDREAIKTIYTPKALGDGAKALKAASSEMNLAGKRLIFARNSNQARILSYVRLQIE